jgi:HEXXH motif-containing protein
MAESPESTRGEPLPASTIITSLMWRSSGVEFADAQARYAGRVGGLLSAMLSDAESQHPDEALSLRSALSGLPDEVLERILLSPNVAHSLLWRHGRQVQPAMDLIIAGIGTEEDQPGKVLSRRGRRAWGPMGDRFRSPDGRVSKPPRIRERIALDLDSPNAIALGPTDHPREATRWQPIRRGERELTISLIGRAFDLLAAAGPAFASLVDACIRVLVTRTRPVDEFCSFSSCEYVGRVALVNPHRVNEYVLAEALVHESIHAYLFLFEPTAQWGLGRASAKPSAVVSPWTGRSLDLRAFLHACFVWFGLFFFWGRALELGIAPSAVAIEGLSRAGRGFTTGDALPAAVDNECVRPEVREAVHHMQRRVAKVLEET